MDAARTTPPAGGTVELGPVAPAGPPAQPAPAATQPTGDPGPAPAPGQPSDAPPAGQPPAPAAPRPSAAAAVPAGVEPVTAPPFPAAPFVGTAGGGDGPPWWDDPTPVTPAAPPYPPDEPAPSLARNFRLLAVAMALFVALIVVAVLAAALFFTGLRGDRAAAPDGTGGRGAAATGSAGAATELSAPLDGRRDAEFELVTGATTVRVRSEELGDDLSRISTPAGAGATPNVVRQGGRVTLHLVPSGGSGPSVVEIRLNARVRWQVRLTGGATEHRVELSGGRLAGVEVVGGATRVDLTLPRPAGVVPVRMTGGATELLVRVPAGVPTRVRVGGGASRLTVDRVSRVGVAAGTVLAPPAWEQSPDRYDIDAVAGVTTLQVDRT